MKIRTIIPAATLAVAATMANAADKAALVEEGKGIIKEFGGALKGELMKAVQAGGPKQGILVCNVKAPGIAQDLSEKSGWEVARSSHKLRNPKNAPDAFTAAAIEEFLQKQAAGEKAVDLAKAEIVEEDGKEIFRLVKAIPTGEVCLACHGGDNVKPEVVETLTQVVKDHLDGPPPPWGDDAPTIELDDLQINQLRALGYGVQ